MESSKEADKEDSQGNRSQATGGPQHRLSLDGANQQVQDSVSSGVANRERDHIQVPPSTQVPKASDSSDPKLLYESDDDRETAEREGDKPSSFAGCDDTPSDTRVSPSQQPQLTTSTASNFLQGTDTTSDLHSLISVVKEAVEAINSFRKSSEAGLAEIKDLAASVSSASCKTNFLLETLIEEMKRPTTTNPVLKTAETADTHSMQSFNSFTVGIVHSLNKFSRESLEEQTKSCVHDVSRQTQTSYTSETNQMKDSVAGRTLETISWNAINPSSRLQPSEAGYYGDSSVCFEKVDHQHSAGNLTPDAVDGKTTAEDSGSSSQASGHEKTVNQKTQPCNPDDEGALQGAPPNIPESELGLEASSSQASTVRDIQQPQPAISIASATASPPLEPSAGDVRPKQPAAGKGTTTTAGSSSKNGSSRHGHANRVSAMGMTFHIEGGSELEAHYLDQALERARAPDPNPPPRARSFDTVLCLDTSESMWQGDAYRQMTNIVKDFIDGVEDIASEVEENIAVVTFGGRSNIAQHLTNDFSLVRDSIDRIEVRGKSPFFEAMLVCLAAFDGKGGTISVSGQYDVPPRIIFITDGHITEGSDDPYGPDRVIDSTNTRAKFSRLMMEMNPKKHDGPPHPIIFVPVGSRADRKFLESMAQLSDGKVVELQNITTLCNYFKVQQTIGKVLVCMNENGDHMAHNIQALANALVPNISAQEMDEVARCVQEELKNPGRKKGQKTRPTDFDEVFEDKDGVAAAHRLPLGTRVTRGPNWIWSNQDGGVNGAGTVVQHEDTKHPITWVVWDAGGYNRYPYGPEMGYHVMKTLEHPVLRRSDGKLVIGMTVKKGPNWNHSLSTFDTMPGVIIRKSRDGRQIKVRWDDGTIQACSVNAVEYSNPLEQDSEADTERATTPEEGMFGSAAEMGVKVPVWQWRDDWGDWRLYSLEQSDCLEKAFQRKKDGTCVIQRNNNSYRVLFKRMVEKDISKGTERDIQRSLIPLDELKSLRVAEALKSGD